jgi:hypothetical protein
LTRIEGHGKEIPPIVNSVLELDADHTMTEARSALRLLSEKLFYPVLRRRRKEAGAHG